MVRWGHPTLAAASIRFDTTSARHRHAPSWSCSVRMNEKNRCGADGRMEGVPRVILVVVVCAWHGRMEGVPRVILLVVLCTWHLHEHLHEPRRGDEADARVVVVLITCCCADCLLLCSPA